MIARAESWSRPADVRAAALVAAAGACLFLVSWAALHEGFYAREQIVDTPTYERYGEAMTRGELPYRDFEVEYPPAALPVFVAPASGEGDYRRRFEGLMAAFGVATVLAVAALLAALGAPLARLAAAVAFVALAPLALGSLLLSRFDLWPALLTVAALAALVAGRLRLGHGVLALAVAAKLYPAVLLPLALLHAWRTRGRRELVACAAAFAAVVAVCVGPFLVLAPGGVFDSAERQLGRPLQLESLGSALLLAAHHLAGLDVEIRSSHGSQNLAGGEAEALGVLLTLAQLAALALVWWSFARGPGGRERLLRASAAAVCAFVALGKVLSPQFLVWLVPLVPLVRGRRGLAASGLLALALVLTQLEFPYRYWDLALELDGVTAALVLARDLVLVALAVVLSARGRG